jgi:hypothetical protein
LDWFTTFYAEPELNIEAACALYFDGEIMYIRLSQSSATVTIPTTYFVKITVVKVICARPELAVVTNEDTINYTINWPPPGDP